MIVIRPILTTRPMYTAVRSMAISRTVNGISLILLVASVISAQSMSPGKFWEMLIKGPLSGPGADEYFKQALKDSFPTAGLARYLEGSLVSIARSKTDIRLLLSMEGTDTADVTLLLHGRIAQLKTEPKRGMLIRFNGVVREFTKEPFMLTFEVNDRGSLDLLNPR
jgi:hypothetical protein